MSTTAKLSAFQQQILAAVGLEWATASAIGIAAGVDRKKAYYTLNSLYTRRLIDRRSIDGNTFGRSEWRLEE